MASAEALMRQDALFDSMVEGVLVLDESNNVRFANGAFAEMFRTTGVLRGRTLVEAARSHELVEIVARAAREGRVVDHEMQPPGQPDRWLEICAAAVSNHERRKLGTILVFHDLTRLKRLERTRQEFVANVSHELRTPLSHIKGYTETLLHGAKDDPEVTNRFLQTIERNAGRLQLLIEDLLTISELESGGVSFNLQPFALKPLIEKICDDFRARAAGRAIAIENHPYDLLVRGDAGRIEQVITNLLDNAIKYGGSGRILLDARPAGEFVEISVQDFGPGLAPEMCERVFERFYRVDKARSRDAGGTGLGLSIVKHIVQVHGGRVWVESTLGEGAKFFFTLPVAASPVQ
jgi:two-component system phosphate regulon sensor histidine kinase PhoR